MYPCGWKDCQKAYGTLNHLNAHVMAQRHGQRQVPKSMGSIVPILSLIALTFLMTISLRPRMKGCVGWSSRKVRP